MRALAIASLSTAVLSFSQLLLAQQPARTLLMVAAHADDESPIGPVLARYAREGQQVYMLVVSDGAQGGANTSIPRGPELAKVRAAEARCAAEALGLRPPTLLDFPDAKLGDYSADPSLLYRATARIAQELERLRPDAIITWGPDGGMGHPDHRIVSNLITQLVRAGAPGAPQRLYYMNIPREGFRAVYPERGVPPLLVPEAKHFTVRIAFAPEDLAAARRAMSCHQTQYTDEVVQRVTDAMRSAWNGAIALLPAFDPTPRTDLFR
jgi:LmbE family N-acetylglucosaminyl deacetylase